MHTGFISAVMTLRTRVRGRCENRGARACLGHESGQAAVLLTVLLMSLLGVAGLAIDYGFWSVSRSQVQSAADAGALAGASAIPAGSGNATAVALQQYGKNGLQGDDVHATPSTDLTTNDSVTVTSTRTVPTWFTGIFGIHSVNVSASARATIESFTSINGLNVMPWGVLQGSYTPGQPYPIYTKNTANANNGALSLPYVRAPTARSRAARTCTRTRSPARPRCALSRSARRSRPSRATTAARPPRG